MNVLPVEVGRMAKVVLENRAEVYDYSVGVNFVSRAIIRFKADNLNNYPIVHTISLTELRVITDRVSAKADRVYKKGLLPNAETLQTTANRLSSFVKIHDPETF